jgi:hypothetical protein
MTMNGISGMTNVQRNLGRENGFIRERSYKASYSRESVIAENSSAPATLRADIRSTPAGAAASSFPLAPCMRNGFPFCKVSAEDARSNPAAAGMLPYKDE